MTLKTKASLLLANKGKIKNTNIYTFTHPELGSFTGFCNDFRKKYNLDKSRGNITRLIKGKAKSVKGWKLLEDNGNPFLNI